MNDLPPVSWGLLLAIAATAGGLIVHYGLPLIRREGSTLGPNGRWQGQVTEILGQNSRTLEAMSRSMAQMTELLSELVRRPHQAP